MNTVKDLILPEFAFIEGWGGNSNDVLKGRNVVLHVRSASVIEMLPDEEILRGAYIQVRLHKQVRRG